MLRSLSLTSDIFDAIRRGDTSESLKGLFQSLRPSDGYLSLKSFKKVLKEHGYYLDDPLAVTVDPTSLNGFPSKIDLNTFQTILHKNVRWHNSLTRRLTITDLHMFRRESEDLFNQSKSNQAGNLPKFPKQLAEQNPDYYGVSFCSVDGQRFSFGDSQIPFSLLNCAKPIIYCMAVEEQGIDKVHQLVGWEPSGRSFNERILNREGKPHNPIINSGSMITASLLKPELHSSDRWEYVSNTWAKLCGKKVHPSINNSLFLTTKAHADREWCLAYMMKEEEGWPSVKNGYQSDTDLNEALEFYFMNQSIELTAEDLAVAAATLANGGVCPVTEKVIFKPITTKNCLSIMFSCGLYSQTGEFAITAGFPATSSQSGAMMVVIPGLGGFCTWSPRLDNFGISARGIAFCKGLSNTFKFHSFDNMLTSKGKIDPRPRYLQGKSAKILLWYAAYRNNLPLIRHIAARGIKLDSTDYDQRTALHLAACGGHKDVVIYLITHGANHNIKDRFGNTPTDDAKREGHNDIVQILTDYQIPKLPVDYPDLMFYVDVTGHGVIRKRELIQELSRLGLQPNDPRIITTFDNIPESFGVEIFRSMANANKQLIKRAITGNLVVPDWNSFVSDVTQMYEETKENKSGNHLPHLCEIGNIDPNMYGVAVCTVDGQQFSIGDANILFSLQDCCKPLNYLIAQELYHNTDVVHRYVGQEPSGSGVNELVMNDDGLPHNPMINSGAIMISALIRSQFESEEQYYIHLRSRYSSLAGGNSPTFDNAVYLKERASSDRNFCLAYMMSEKGVFPKEKKDLRRTLDLFSMCSSLTYNAKDLAIVAATLASGGVCPVTQESVINSTYVKNCLSLMYSCGMHDYSGAFAFEVGFPAKSAVSGALMIVIPNVMGICTFSPRLTTHGISSRGINFCKLFAERYNFHHFDATIHLYQGDNKADPRQFPLQRQVFPTCQLLYAASIGDLREIQKLQKIGVDLESVDYDGRSALHLAASEGQRNVVEFLLAHNVNLEPKDRWGLTPLEAAETYNQTEIVHILKNHMQMRKTH